MILYPPMIDCYVCMYVSIMSAYLSSISIFSLSQLIICLLYHKVSSMEADFLEMLHWQVSEWHFVEHSNLSFMFVEYMNNMDVQSLDNQLCHSNSDISSFKQSQPLT